MSVRERLFGPSLKKGQQIRVDLPMRRQDGGLHSSGRGARVTYRTQATVSGPDSVRLRLPQVGRNAVEVTLTEKQINQSNLRTPNGRLRWRSR